MYGTVTQQQTNMVGGGVHQQGGGGGGGGSGGIVGGGVMTSGASPIPQQWWDQDHAKNGVNPKQAPDTALRSVTPAIANTRGNGANARNGVVGYGAHPATNPMGYSNTVAMGAHATMNMANATQQPPMQQQPQPGPIQPGPGPNVPVTLTQQQPTQPQPQPQPQQPPPPPPPGVARASSPSPTPRRGMSPSPRPNGVYYRPGMRSPSPGAATRQNYVPQGQPPGNNATAAPYADRGSYGYPTPPPYRPHPSTGGPVPPPSAPSTPASAAAASAVPPPPPLAASSPPPPPPPKEPPALPPPPDNTAPNTADTNGPKPPSATGLIRLTLKKPMGIVFEPMTDPHNSKQQRGVRICDLPRTGAAALSRKLEVGDELLSINDKTMSRLTFDEIMDFIIEADPDKVNLLFRRPRKEALAQSKAAPTAAPGPGVQGSVTANNSNSVKWVDDPDQKQTKRDERKSSKTNNRDRGGDATSSHKHSSDRSSSNHARQEDPSVVSENTYDYESRDGDRSSVRWNGSKKRRGKDDRYDESFLDMLIDNICSPLVQGDGVCRDRSQGNRSGGHDDYYTDDDDRTFTSADDSTYVTYESESVTPARKSANGGGNDSTNRRNGNNRRTNDDAKKGRNGGQSRDDDTYDDTIEEDDETATLDETVDDTTVDENGEDHRAPPPPPSSSRRAGGTSSMRDRVASPAMATESSTSDTRASSGDDRKMLPDTTTTTKNKADLAKSIAKMKSPPRNNRVLAPPADVKPPKKSVNEREDTEDEEEEEEDDDVTYEVVEGEEEEDDDDDVNSTDRPGKPRPDPKTESIPRRNREASLDRSGNEVNARAVPNNEDAPPPVRQSNSKQDDGTSTYAAEGPISELEYDRRVDHGADVSVMESLGGPSLLLEAQRHNAAVAAGAAAAAATPAVSAEVIANYGHDFPADLGATREETILRDPDRFYGHVVLGLLQANEPEKVRLIDKLLAKYKGREEHLIQKLSVRYSSQGKGGSKAGGNKSVASSKDSTRKDSDVKEHSFTTRSSTAADRSTPTIAEEHGENEAIPPATSRAAEKENFGTSQKRNFPNNRESNNDAGEKFETFGSSFPVSDDKGKKGIFDTNAWPPVEDSDHKDEHSKKMSDEPEREHSKKSRDTERGTDEDSASYTSATGSEYSGDSIDGTSPAVIAQVSELLNYVYGKTSVPGQIDRVSTIMRAYEGREAVLLELLETKALLKANAENEAANNLPAVLRNSPALKRDSGAQDGTDQGAAVGSPVSGLTTPTAHEREYGATVINDEISSISGTDEFGKGGSSTTPSGLASPSSTKSDGKDDEKVVISSQSNTRVGEHTHTPGKNGVKPQSVIHSKDRIGELPSREESQQKKKGIFGGIFRGKKGKKGRGGEFPTSSDNGTPKRPSKKNIISPKGTKKGALLNPAESSEGSI